MKTHPVDLFLAIIVIGMVLVCIVSWEVYAKQPTPKIYTPIQPRGEILPTLNAQIDGAASTTTLPAATNVVPVYVKDKTCFKLMSGLICN